MSSSAMNGGKWSSSDARPSLLITVVVSLHTGSQWAKQCVRKCNMALSFNSRLNADGYRLPKSFSAAVIRQSAGAHATLVSLECHSHIFSLTVTLPPKLLSVLNKKHDTASGFHVTRHTKGLRVKKLKGNICLSSSLSVIFFHPVIYCTSDTLMLTVSLEFPLVFPLIHVFVL